MNIKLVSSILLVSIVCHATQKEDAYFNLATVFQTEGNSQEAILNFKKILETNPHHAEALLQMGIELYKQGATAEAISYFEQRLKLIPGCPKTNLYLGMSYAVQEAFDKAIECYRQGLHNDPNNPKINYCLGIALQKKGIKAEALEVLQRSATLDPQNHEIRMRIALLLRDEQPTQALAYFNELGQLFPHNKSIILEKARLYATTHQLDAALACYHTLLQTSPHDSAILSTIARLQIQQKDIPAAIGTCTKILSITPDNSQTHFSLGKLYVAQDNLEQGFDHLYQMNGGGERVLKSLDQADGATIFIQGEWFHEDVIQLMRYTRELKQRNAFVILQVPQAIQPLVSSCPYVDKIVSIEHPQMCHVDYQTSLFSLPFLCGNVRETLVHQEPYLHADQTRCAQWRSRLAANNKPKIGLYLRKSLANLAYQELFTLLSHYDCEFYILQLPDTSAPFTALPYSMILHRCGSGFDESTESLLDVAALMRNLDCIVSTDCTMAHLAGALGLQGCVLVENTLSWQWVARDNYSLWYPTLKVLQQDDAGSWQQALANLEAVMTKLCS